MGEDMKNIPYYVPEICDGHYCPMDCEAHCPWADEAMEFIANQEEDDDVEPSDDYLELGFDPYLGCYTDDC